jgi:hypothetical protein
VPGIEPRAPLLHYYYPYQANDNKHKYYIITKNEKKIYFGAAGYSDFTQHKNKDRQQNYKKRSSNIKGNWKNNKYSPNNLAINILW